jgi:hypothetical protein
MSHGLERLCRGAGAVSRLRRTTENQEAGIAKQGSKKLSRNPTLDISLAVASSAKFSSGDASTGPSNKEFHSSDFL